MKNRKIGKRLPGFLWRDSQAKDQEKEEKAEQWIRRTGDGLKIPESLLPERIEQKIMAHGRKTQKKGRGYFPKSLAVLACLAVLGSTVFMTQGSNGRLPLLSWLVMGTGKIGEQKGNNETNLPKPSAGQKSGEKASTRPEEEVDEGWQEGCRTSYEEIYALMKPAMEPQFFEERSADLSGTNSYKQGGSAAAVDYTRTNNRETEVEECDIIKNDGRYLYQVVGDGEGRREMVQITDTKGGLKVLVQLMDFTNIIEINLVGEQLIVAEQEGNSSATCGIEEDWAEKQPTQAGEECYSISLYDMEDKKNPHLAKIFRFRGRYKTSRVVNGYLYVLGAFQAKEGEGEQDYASYIPGVDGALLKAKDIWVPEGAEGALYLILASVDLEHPEKLAAAKAVLTTARECYMSENNIYMTKYLGVLDADLEAVGKSGMEKTKRKVRDQTEMLKIAYADGDFSSVKETRIDGRLLNSFSMDEYEGNLRLAATVEEFGLKEITEEPDGQKDRDGTDGGKEEKKEKSGKRWTIDYEECNTSSSLYVLDEDMKLIGSIKNLAKGEQIYSVRFLGSIGYFVTFRQVDPMFSVDLSKPEKPHILGKQKFTGFSNYLHPCGEEQLLGIGAETDEKGRQQGMKLSLFDISDPKNVKESKKMVLDQYDYSEAFYEHRVVMVDTGRCLFGFPAVGYTKSGKWKSYFLVYSYQDEFLEKLAIFCEDSDQARGTCIGNQVYLLSGSGSIKAYDLETGEKTDEIKGLSE